MPAQRMPVMFEPEPAWMADGVCRRNRIPVDVFFPAAESGTQQRLQRDAISICRSCPVVEQCRDYAIEHHLVGVWGATTERQRRHLRALSTGPRQSV